jgi:uncharacterized LabA/DUF88 family protein
LSGSHYLPDSLKAHTKAMMFIDGENLAIRYKELLNDNELFKVLPHVKYREDTYIWSHYANIPNHVHCEVVRKYYYSAVQGDNDLLNTVIKELKDQGIESPEIFKKKKGRSSKRVDITLATDMLTHAHRKNYDIAILVAGDDDYVPLVKAIKAEGRRVILWFFQDSKGLSQQLVNECDYFFDISWFLLKPEEFMSKYC